MTQYSKSILASLFFAAAFNFAAHADVSPNIETSRDAIIAAARATDMALKMRAVQAGLIGADVDSHYVLSDAVKYSGSGVKGLKRLLSLETETQKWSGRQIGTALDVAAKDGKVEYVKFFLEEMVDRIPDADFSYALRDAAKEGYMNIVGIILEKKADVISVNEKNSALRHVVEAGDLENVKRLYKAGAQQNYAWLAAGYGHLSIVKYIMENDPNALSAENMGDADGRSGLLGALEDAASAGHMPVVQYLVEEQHIPVNIKREDGKEYSLPLAAALSWGRADIAEFLFDHGASSNGITLNHMVEDENWDIVRMAVSNGVNLTDTYRYFENFQDRNAYEESLLARLKKFMAENNISLRPVVESNPMDEHALIGQWWAHKNGPDDIFQSSLLNDAVLHDQFNALEHLLSLETETRKWPAEEIGNAMEDAIVFNHRRMINLLVETKADAISAEDRNNILQWAVLADQPEYQKLRNIKILHRAGADIRDDNDRALHLAAENGILPVVQYLMENGASALNPVLPASYSPGFDSFGALDDAVMSGHLPVVRYMIEEQHVPVNMQDSAGTVYSPALADGFYRSQTKIVEYLYDHGAVSVGPDDGEGVLALAVRKGDWDMVRVGLAHGMTLTNTYRHFSQHTDIYARPLGELKNFMVENNIPLPAAVPAPTNPAPSP